jgi:S-DNA-T family DNA segregation ATPase FtsK/SpoIIIE
MQRQLNTQADRIELVLAHHKAPARVWGGRLTDRTIQFDLTPAAHTKLRTLQALTEEVALALGTPSARLTRHAGRLSLEVPRADAPPLALTTLAQSLLQDEHLRRVLAVAGTAILGRDTEGVPLLLRLASPEVAHCLIAGTTGSGKTELARTLLASLLLHQKPRDIQLALFDPKGRGFAPFAAAPHLLFPLVQSPVETLARLEYLVAEMERREREAIERPRIVVVVDELADLLQTCGRELEELLTRLVQRGRSAGVSVVACTQKPSAQVVGSLLKANFPVRLVGRVASAEDARVAAGVGGTGAEKLVGRGDFLLIAGGEQIRFQAALIRPEELAALIVPRRERAEGRGSRRLRLLK